MQHLSFMKARRLWLDLSAKKQIGNSQNLLMLWDRVTAHCAMNNPTQWWQVNMELEEQMVLDETWCVEICWSLCICCCVEQVRRVTGGHITESAGFLYSDAKNEPSLHFPPLLAHTQRSSLLEDYPDVATLGGWGHGHPWRSYDQS